MGALAGADGSVGGLVKFAGLGDGVTGSGESALNGADIFAAHARGTKFEEALAGSGRSRGGGETCERILINDEAANGDGEGEVPFSVADETLKGNHAIDGFAEVGALVVSEPGAAGFDVAVDPGLLADGGGSAEGGICAVAHGAKGAVEFGVVDDGGSESGRELELRGGV